MTTDKILDKLRKLKAHAESAEAIGSEAEAQAFADKINAMLLEHNLELSDLEFEALEEEQPVDREYVDLRRHGIKSKKVRTAWAERLASIVARANFCRVIVQPGSNNFWLVGRREHRAVAEYLIVTLTRAAEEISRKEHARYSWEVYKRDKSTYAARGFREAFLQAFVMRLFDRLEARRRATVVETTALVRVDRETRAVDDFMDQLKKNKTVRSGSSLQRSTGSHAEGVRRGRAAADAANLEGRAVETSTQRREIGS